MTSSIYILIALLFWISFSVYFIWSGENKVETLLETFFFCFIGGIFWPFMIIFITVTVVGYGLVTLLKIK